MVLPSPVRRRATPRRGAKLRWVSGHSVSSCCGCWFLNTVLVAGFRKNTPSTGNGGGLYSHRRPADTVSLEVACQVSCTQSESSWISAEVFCAGSAMSQRGLVLFYTGGGR